jgi:hypothetical protein
VGFLGVFFCFFGWVFYCQPCLQELVKQNFKKIVPSVEYFDEEKFEGGKRKKKVVKKNATPEGGDHGAVATDGKEKDEKEISAVSGEEADKTSSAVVSPSAEGKSGKRKPSDDSTTTPASQKKTKKAAASSKKVKTKCGTFSVTDTS